MPIASELPPDNSRAFANSVTASEQFSCLNINLSQEQMREPEIRI
jgi:hypothetical protein